jgi:ABC-type multidrug transport system ATPase subunit
VVLTTQYLEEADRLADRIAVIDRGRVIADDTPAVLKARLGSTVIEFGMADEQAAVGAAGLLDRQRGPHPEREGAAIRLTSNDGSDLLMDALHALDAGHLRPAELQVRQPSLDDVFLVLTGHHAEDGDDLRRTA